MRRVFVPTTGARDWQRLLAKPDLHWTMGKSAMATAVAWEAAGDGLPPEVARVLDSTGDPLLKNLKLLAALPEWETPLHGGTTSSMTDVLALASNAKGLVVLGVEGKVDEDFGPTLAEKRAGASDGQSGRIDYLHRELQLDSALPGHVRYQLLHRTVSALFTAREFHAGAAVMLVHSFGRDPRLKDDYAAFCAAMGATPVSDHMCVVPRFEAPRLFLAWCVGDAKHLDVDARS